MNTARIISIGDELLQGASTDTNAAWLAGRLHRRGILVDGVATVPDEVERIAAALESAATRADLVIVTGGLGPTPDDVTRAGLAAALGCAVIEDPAAVDWIRGFLESKQFTMTDRQRSMGCRPERADWHATSRGSAPILSAGLHEAVIWILPGPPAEMRQAWKELVAPSLPPTADASCWSGSLRCQGLIEADAADRLGTLLDRSNEVMLGTRVSDGLFIVTATGPDEVRGRAALDAARACLHPWSFDPADESMSQAVGRVLRDTDATVSTAESCTGGGIGSMLVDTSGSSAWYHGGVVTYTNASKIRELDVATELFGVDGPGAVSRDVAGAMAKGVRRRFGTHWSVAVTGIAGPDGGTPMKPAGTVWIAVDGESGTDVRHFQFSGGRAAVRMHTALTALQLLRLHVLGEAGGVRLSRERDA